MQRNSTLYTILFSVAMCVVCSLLVASAAVVLSSRQEVQAQLYRQKNVLLAAGLIKDGQVISDREIIDMFNERIEARFVDLTTGEYTNGEDPATYNQRAARDNPKMSFEAPENNSQIKRVPNKAIVFHVMKDGAVDAIVIPIEGYGLWGTLYGYFALEKDANTIRGITYYDQKETPGLGGEVANPRWKALWPGREAYDENGAPAIRVIKGAAGPVDEAPHQIDGLSGATITSNGVTNMLTFWLGENGFGPFLDKFREKGGA